MSKFLSLQGAVFLLFFTLFAFAAMQVNFSSLVGANNQFFTYFQFIGPIAGGFLGIFGVATVLAAQLINLAFSSKPIDMLTLLRLLPMLFATYYFSRNEIAGLKDKFGILIPAAAMFIFWLHPVGQQVWYYALFWAIPIIVKFLPDRLFLRSLGATLTAHAVGGAIWIWSVPMTAAQYNFLIPVTAYERILFALGISLSYVLFTSIMGAADKIANLELGRFLNIEKRYVLAF